MKDYQTHLEKLRQDAAECACQGIGYRQSEA
jgi:hypothetical protein